MAVRGCKGTTVAGPPVCSQSRTPWRSAKAHELRFVLRRRRREDAQHQADHVALRALADRHLDLRQAVADRQAGHQLAQRHQQRGERRRHHVAFRHVGDEARLALVEADQHGTLLHDVAHGQPRAAAIAPRRPGDRRQQRLRPHAADARERILERTLLGGDLQRRVGVLQRATAADAEVGAARRDARGARLARRGSRARWRTTAGP